MENIDEKKLYEIQFVQLIFSLKTSAIMQLGKIANPLTGKIERNLNEAKYTIDMLNMLKEKTKNNLAPDEEKIINDAIFELQMNYIDEVKKGEEEKKETKPEEEKSKEESAEKQEPKEESKESKEHVKKEEKEKEKKSKGKIKENLDKKRKKPKAKKKNENKA
ncbi:MAG: DUF1844 domain-containing protein [Nanoarchaeota archaeon]|nr:DUF1844 domain-containing protein [Nanoarchaeota archaeon]